ncbi:uncharacterized protein LOC143063191 [Mytilus galloprovincialis]|uniref:uncharacterized protein LOC143063191 n=1 Tax=Mytilus galloprovincialis TaxID=29158 RepID=UPI003F7C9D0C
MLKERLDLNAWKKLDNNIVNLKDFVDRRQRHIHRLSSSKIQSILKQIYEECSADKGKGVIQRMKMKLEKGIDTQRKDMFQEVSKEIVAELEALMEVIKEDILSVCTKLVRTIKMMFEPLWTHAATQDLRSTLFHDVDKAEQELTTLCDIFGIKKDFGSKTRTGGSSATTDLILDFTGEGSLLTTPLLCDGISIDCIADKRLDERHFITNVKDKDMNCLLSNLNQQKSDEFTCLVSFLHFFKDRHTLDSKSIHQLLKHAVSNGQSLMCRLALSFIGDILKSEPLITQMLILALVNDEKDCAKAISWFIVRAFYLQNRFAIKQSLVEDIWPAIRCMSTNRASRSPCLEDVVIVVELGSDRPNIPKEFCQIQVMFLTKGDISSSERLLANSQLKNRNESLYLQESIVSGIDAENLFTKHSKLTLICKSYTTFFENDSQHNYRQVPYVKLFCRAKGYIPIGEDRFPREVCGMPTDILQGAPSLMANLKVGSKIGGEVNKMGTLGGFVKVRGDTCFLTCCHVLLSDEDLASENISLDDDKWIEVQCYFPGSPTDHKQIKSYKCGRIRDIAFEVDNANETSIDAALVTLNDGIQIHEKDYLENGHGQSYPCSVLGMQSTFLNKNSVDYKQFCYSTPRQTVDIVTVGAVSGLNTTYRSIVDENNETSINIESLLQTFSTAKTAVVKEGVIFAIQKIRGMNISNISSDHIWGAIEDVCDAKISKDVKKLLADITTTWFQTVENAHENMDTNTNNISSQTVENEHENMDTNTNNISSQTVENEHENMDTNTNNIQENSTFYEARDLAHLQSSEWEMIDQIIKSKTERVSSTITGDVHMQEMCLINTEDRLNKMRTSRRMYNQIHVSDIRFKPGDSGTCLYIISPVQGCLGMAIANHPQGGCIATPIKEILKHFKIKIN